MLVARIFDLGDQLFDERALFDRFGVEALEFSGADFVALSETIIIPKISPKFSNFGPNFKNLRPFEGVDFRFS